jgi:hypothetical protein
MNSLCSVSAAEHRVVTTATPGTALSRMHLQQCHAGECKSAVTPATKSAKHRALSTKTWHATNVGPTATWSQNTLNHWPGLQQTWQKILLHPAVAAHSPQYECRSQPLQRHSLAARYLPCLRHAGCSAAPAQPQHGPFRPAHQLLLCVLAWMPECCCCPRQLLSVTLPCPRPLLLQLSAPPALLLPLAVPPCVAPSALAHRVLVLVCPLPAFNTRSETS